MKKVLLSIFGLTFIVLCLAGCGTKNIKLTKDNANQYLDISVKCYPMDLNDRYGVKNIKITDSFYANQLSKSFSGTLKVLGTSTNFNYDNVSLKVKIRGTYKAYKKDSDYKETVTKDFELILESKPNISGNADTVSEKVQLEDNLLTHEYLIDYDYEIIEISGNVSPA